MSERYFLHVDMDAFFASVEQRDNPALRGKPVIVGSPPNQRGVVSTCSYEARQFGVHSAMPSQTAYRLCPQGIFLPGRSEAYSAASRQIFEIFQRFTPDVEKISCDEAFLDITGSKHLFGGDLATAQRIQATIWNEVGLTASVGIAPNKFLAKIASDMKKPNGITVVPRDPQEIIAFLAPLPIKRIWGVGKVTEKHLHKYGITHIEHLQRLSENNLIELLGTRGGTRFYQLSRGLDERRIVERESEKSISNEHTFRHDCGDWKVVEQSLLMLTEKVGGRLRKAGYLARTAQIKVRWSNFQTITRQAPLNPPSQTDRILIDTAMSLLERERCPRSVRLIGFGVHNLMDPDEPIEYQPDLFADVEAPREDERNQTLDNAVDRIRDQFGSSSLHRGNWKRK